jgi:hypothetical protein
LENTGIDLIFLRGKIWQLPGKKEKKVKAAQNPTKDLFWKK